MARKPKSETVKTDEVVTDQVSVPAETDEEAMSGTAQLSELNEAQQEKPKCGGTLNAAREAQGLSVQEVAKQLRLGVKQIEALETDNFAALPEATIVKGFIRNYAKLLKIQSEPLVAAYIASKPEKEQHAYTLNPGINMKISEHKKSDVGRYFIFTFLLLIAAGIWFFYQNYVQKPSPVNPIPEIVEALPELALPATERASGSGETYQLDMPDQAASEDSIASDNSENASATANVESTDMATNDVVVSTDTVADAAEVPVTESEQNSNQESSAEDSADAPVPGKTRLAFTATQETWLSVVNASGKEVYNKILYAGNHDVIDVWNPAEIVVGNAHGATLIVDGKPIDLAPYTRINVARVRLDR